ncbi:MAG TPA: methionine ABC transporter permease [Clostridium sp.]|jgi:D-methionine transport system permease protein|uniref:Methionine ABC transporter permease n=1 Tax=Clostridium lapidicellarium TaxID=3240931 RepID=A0ABV4E0G4_9CLOT|nr:methionine ABC transporter permease [uncultured Clostridium sp.]NLU07575.1 ABC transporter permease [Clostridiales bacterium]HBC97856.1 methionine ABC transporter permease [Clostridium sp.]
MTEDFKMLILKGLSETIEMVAISGFIALLIGMPLGIILVVTKKGHILEHEKLNKVLAAVVNAIRSLPSIILIVVLLPLARLIVGTTLGMKAAIVPISIGIAPFLARIIETSIEEVQWGKIEAALAVGAKPFQIILKVLIPEALPSLVRGITISIISIIEFTAVAGAIGAGGLGSLAIRFGYERFRKDIMIATVVLLICLVQLIQFSGDHISRYINKKRYKFD